MSVEDAILSLNPLHYRVGDVTTANQGSSTASWTNQTRYFGDYVRLTPVGQGTWHSGTAFTMHNQWSMTAAAEVAGSWPLYVSRYGSSSAASSNSLIQVRAASTSANTVDFRCGVEYVSYTHSEPVNDGKTHSTTIVYNGAGYSRFYFDGVLVGEFSGYPSGTNYPLFAWRGSTDEVTRNMEHTAIFDRVLTDEEVMLMQAPPSAEPLDLFSGGAESRWTVLAAQVSLAEPAATPLALSTGQAAEAVWKALGARVELVTPVPTPLIVQSGTAAQATFRGMGGRIVLTQPPAGQLTLIAGEQAEAIWQALAAQAELTEPVFIPVGEWQLSAFMPKGEVMASMRTNSAEATMVRSQSNTRMTSNSIETVMASKVLWPELKEEA